MLCRAGIFLLHASVSHTDVSCMHSPLAPLLYFSSIHPSTTLSTPTHHIHLFYYLEYVPTHIHKHSTHKSTHTGSMEEFQEEEVKSIKQQTIDLAVTEGKC
jgi:hypothetical protein